MLMRYYGGGVGHSKNGAVCTTDDQNSIGNDGEDNLMDSEDTEDIDLGDNEAGEDDGRGSDDEEEDKEDEEEDVLADNDGYESL